MQLRWYQKESLNAVALHLKYQPDVSGYVVAPCRSGKSIMIAALADYLAKQGYRVDVLAMSEKLVDQNHDKAPNKDICGIYSAGLNRLDLDKQITYATIQSIHSKTTNARYAIVDEADLIHPDSESDTQYHSYFRRNNNPTIIGFTGTPYRSKSGLIQWGDKIHEIALMPLIEQGFVIPPISKLAHIPDTSSVKITAGEFNGKDLNKIYDDADLLKLSIEKILQYHRNRSIVFSQSVEHGKILTENLNNNGLPSIFVDGNTPKDDLRKIIELHELGTYKVLVNCMLATTGYDLPWLDMVALIRATNSKRLFEQMAWRGGTPYEGKKDFLLLDMGGNLARHGPLGSPYREKAKKERDAPSQGKICPYCETFTPPLSKECPDCGHIFPEVDAPKINHDDAPDTSSQVVYSADPYQWFDVSAMRFSLSKTKKNIPCIIASFFVNGYQYPSIKKWLMPHHESSFARGAFLLFMKKLGDEIYVGEDSAALKQYNMDDLLWRCENNLTMPTRIKVDMMKEFTEIVDYEIYSEAEPEISTGDLLADEIPF